MVSKHAHDVFAGLEIWSSEASVAAQQRVDGAPALVIVVDVEARHRLGRRFVAEGVGRNVWSGGRADVWRSGRDGQETLSERRRCASRGAMKSMMHHIVRAWLFIVYIVGVRANPRWSYNQSIIRPRRRRRRF